MKKQLTVTIGIPAFNEEKNIRNMLSAVLQQTGSSFVLENIIVLCDGCTDKTESRAKAFAKKDTRIIVMSDGLRKGKVTRLNQLYRVNTSDILITFDADILLSSTTTINEMVKVFIEEKNTVLVAAHQIPLPLRSFTGRIIYAGYQFWDRARLAVKNHDHIQNLYGAATAVRKSFIRHVQFPSDITDDRGYLYLKAKQYGNFHYTMNASILYWPVSTLQDFLQLSDRSFSKNQDALAKYFSPKVYDMYTIPTRYKIKAIGKTFLKNPVYTTLAVLLNIYIRLFPRHDNLYTSGMWEICSSTKQAITYKLLPKGLQHYGKKAI